MLSEQAAALCLRRINRIRTIQGSLAIEGNTLSEEQITAILEGKRMIAPPREIQEARNAILASTPQDSPHVTPQVMRLLRVINEPMSRDQLQAALGLRDRKSFRERYLRPALKAGLIAMTLPDKPNSRLQQYQLTAAGKSVVSAEDAE